MQVRRVVVGAAVAAVAATGGLVGPGGPAYAGLDPVRRAAASGHNDAQLKTVTVHCPQEPSVDWRVFGAGGAVVGGAGRVALTRVEPDPELRSVTVEARAAAGYGGAWSVVAFATCDSSVDAVPHRVAAGSTADSATATCPGRSRLVGTGFRLTPGGHLDQLVPDEELTRVRAHAIGHPGVTAFGICFRFRDRNHPVRRVGSTVDLAPAGATTVLVQDTGDLRMYGVGGQVSGASGAFLDVLMADVDSDTATVEAVRPGGGAQPAAKDGDGGSATGYGILLGTFH